MRIPRCTVVHNTRTQLLLHQSLLMMSSERGMGRRGRKRSQEDRQRGQAGPGSEHSADCALAKVERCDGTAPVQPARHIAHACDTVSSGGTHCTENDALNSVSNGDTNSTVSSGGDTGSTCSTTAKERQRLGRPFYDVCGEDLARALLGQKIVRMVDGVRLCARIVETEAYLGAVDKAAHSYKRRTDRNHAMFMQPGTAYVYNIYGMYCCLNISSQGAGCAVLIRSIEPLEGVEKMRQLKKEKSKSSASKPLKVSHLANGPAKMCQALSITKLNLNQHDLVMDPETWLEKGEPVSEDHVVVSTRINIGYAEEWIHKPLRFYLLHNPCVSVRDKAAEKQLQDSTVAS